MKDGGAVAPAVFVIFDPKGKKYDENNTEEIEFLFSAVLTGKILTAQLGLSPQLIAARADEVCPLFISNADRIRIGNKAFIGNAHVIACAILSI
jgi:hypothetical protein